jgi:hypothetical protein
MIIFLKISYYFDFIWFCKVQRKVLWFLLFYFDEKSIIFYFIMNRSLINKSRATIICSVLSNTMLVNLQSEIKFPSSSVILFPQKRSSFVNNSCSPRNDSFANTSNDLPIFQFHVLLVLLKKLGSRTSHASFC